METKDIRNSLREVRLEKLAKIKALGINPYPAKFKRDLISVVRKKSEDEKVDVGGRVMAIRGHGGMTFADILDDSGKIQIGFKKDTLGDEKYSLLDLFDLGDFVGVSGVLFTTKAGELTVLADSFEMLSKALRPLPSTWHGLKDTEERFRKRYLDFIFNPEVKEKIKTRTKIVKYLRRFLDEKGFLEIETPILETDASGASARPFVTHINAYDIDLYLRICMGELWQKRLLVGGFDKTYEIGRAFRNEGVDFQHNPEFTMLEYYWGYADYEDNMRLHEELFSGLVKELTGSFKITFNEQEIDFTPPFKRLTYKTALKDYANLDLDKFRTKESLASEMEKRNLAVDPKAGRGKLIDDFYKETVRPKLIGPLFLTDHPIDISPLAKKTTDQNFVQRFQLLILGAEMSNSYSELNDPLDQAERFKEQAKLINAGDEEAMGVDWDFVEAMEYGMPPITGTGIGIDRLTSLLTDSHALREIIAFPLMKPGNKNVDKGIKEDKPLPNTKKEESKKINTQMITREEALNFLNEKVSNKNIIKHMLATEALMGGVYDYCSSVSENSDLDGTKTEWELAGLLHDGDYAEGVPMEKQGVQITEWLREHGYEVPENIAHAMAAHNWHGTGVEPVSKMDWAIFCGDSLTGLIVAGTLVLPSKKLSDLTVESIMKRFNEKSFAKGTRRDEIAMCEEKLGVPLSEFVKIGLVSMQKIAGSIGL